MSSRTPDELPISKIPDFIEERVIEILGEEEPKRQQSLRELLETVPEHAAAIRKWLETALDGSREADRELAETLGLLDTKEEEPVRVGPYRILEPIGHGGMGSVYLAEQIELLRRRVALKLIKLGMDTREVIARFEAERQALAMMSHPNIARVYDAGVTEHGRPYFVMEYVPGVAITQYCDTHRLRLEERLDLFIQVCDAVKHAHQRGILHRDLKPSNVLVMRLDGKPVPKIIDFGVAKATNQRLTERTIFTQQGRIIGTPEYMSPEQAETSGLEVDPRTDVYSLGVLLYELLCGDLPFDRERLRKAGLAEIHRIIREEEPPRPSQRVASRGSAADQAAYHRRLSAKHLQKELLGALDWITMTAMEKDPARRYPDADQLGADCARYLNHERVEAGPPSSVYRLRTLLRRHRVMVRAALVSLVVLAASIWLLSQKDSHLRDARRESASAREDIVQRDQEISRLQGLLAQAQRDLAAAKRVEPPPQNPAAGEQLVALQQELEREKLRGQQLQTSLDAQKESAARLSSAIGHARAVEQLTAQIDRLVAEAELLGALSDADVKAMGSWLERADEAAAFGAELAAKLKGTADEVPGGARLPALLEALGKGERGLIGRVRARRVAAEAFAHRSLVEASGAWTEALARIAANSGPYSGLRMTPRLGFVPLGPDPVSKLEEFAFLPSGEVPKRDPQGKLRLDDASALVCVLLPIGELQMAGTAVNEWRVEVTPFAGPLQHPLRTVLLDAFLIGKYELNQGQWLRCFGRSNPSTFAAGREVDKRVLTARHPVESVSYDEAVAALRPWGLELPTEAQWEYATRAGTYETWSSGKDERKLREVGNLLDRSGFEFGLNVGGGRFNDSDGFAVHAPVGSFAANPFGLHDVHGNVAEWCRDWLVGYDAEVEPGDGAARGVSSLRVHRGGSFLDRSSAARSRYRDGAPPQNRAATIGLRVSARLQ